MNVWTVAKIYELKLKIFCFVMRKTLISNSKAITYLNTVASDAGGELKQQTSTFQIPSMESHTITNDRKSCDNLHRCQRKSSSASSSVCLFTTHLGLLRDKEVIDSLSRTQSGNKDRSRNVTNSPNLQATTIICLKLFHHQAIFKM